jgi:hypothetical protein
MVGGYLVSPEYELLNDVSVAGEPGRIHQLCTTFPLLPNTSHLTILREVPVPLRVWKTSKTGHLMQETMLLLNKTTKS